MLHIINQYKNLFNSFLINGFAEIPSTAYDDVKKANESDNNITDQELYNLEKKYKPKALAEALDSFYKST